MVQKWDYKTVLSERGGVGERFEIDGAPATRPKDFVTLFKELGRDGWELVAHSASTLPPPFVSMTDEERADFPLIEDDQIHPMRQPVMVYWWIFKRPLSVSPRISAVAPADAVSASPPAAAVEVTKDAVELKRQYQVGERNFSGAQLSGAKLSGVNLTKADLCRSDLSGADLTDANLTKADLSGADLSGTDFYQATLVKTNMNGADLTGAMLWEAQLRGADFTDANLEGAHIEDKQLAHLASLRGATMPDGTRHG
jgi:hypothetical protein